jgi:hypothetical protein
VVTLSGTAVNGTLTVETPAFNYKSAKGTWALEVDGLAGVTLNSWSMSVLESLTQGSAWPPPSLGRCSLTSIESACG